MKYLTLEYARQYGRIDNDCENEVLAAIIEAAEDAVLNYLGRTVEELETIGGGCIPNPVVLGTALLVNHLYEHRESNVRAQDAVADNTGCLLLPYMSL